jgi:hypothetical protein
MEPCIIRDRVIADGPDDFLRACRPFLIYTCAIRFFPAFEEVSFMQPMSVSLMFGVVCVLLVVAIYFAWGRKSSKP